MIKYVCDMCGKALLEEEDTRYVIKIDVYAAFEGSESPDDYDDHDTVEEFFDGADDGAGSGFDTSGGMGGGDSEEDALYDEAVRFVTESRRASISAVQRKLKIGYNRAARMIETMEMAGVVTSMNTNGSREVIAPPPVRD